MAFFGESIAYRCLREEMASAREKIRDLKRKIKEIELKERDCSIVFDFDKVDVFSIERQPISSRTVVGYWSTDEKGNRIAREWYFNCSAPIHENLVANYESYKSKRKS
jgi:hypothetical protein